MEEREAGSIKKGERENDGEESAKRREGEKRAERG